ncbi:uncharacterized protein LOC129909458 [Episyrphus balteatus]|uniref:uncharacterized protein LOC129909458 n=1 Tax=Episyrphus balteatus TaxID=286459 RepID=UPI0024868E6B|nr:uncharacterized protein LOC129909458 [Episyrphus balteatus]
MFPFLVSPFSPILGSENLLNSQNIPHGFISSTQIEYLDSQMIDLSDEESQISTSSNIKKRKLFKDENTPQKRSSQQSTSNSSFKPDNNTSNISEKLDLIIANLHTLSMRMDKIEGQISVHCEQYSQNVAESEAKQYAENKILRENLIINRHVQKMVSSFTGDESNENNNEIEAIFPMSTMAQMNDMELRLKDAEFAGKLELYLRRYSTKLEKVFRFLGEDSLYKHFNLEGRAGKKSLYDFNLYKKIFFDACGTKLGKDQFEKEVRKCVLNTHNR